MSIKTLFIIGGMGAGKSTATKALVSQGLPVIDLDKIGHDVLKWETVKWELVDAFGDGILDENAEVVRSRVAELAFVTPADTRKLNRITMPRIEQAYYEALSDLEAQGHKACVVEYSVFKRRDASLAAFADVVIAILAPVEVRIARAVASGWDEVDVRRRIARQITDAQRIDQADVVFNNNSSKEELENQVLLWWAEFKKQEGL